MKAHIITVGDEIVSGFVLDTNSVYLAGKLAEAGITVGRKTSVRDHVEEIAAEIDAALAGSDMVFLTGGLGPTHDDCTKKAVCESFGIELVESEDILGRVRQRYESRGVEMPEASRSLAMVPAGAELLPNPLGSAVGLKLTREGRPLYVLPGVPGEMKAIFEGSIETGLLSLDGRASIKTKVLRTTGLTESAIAELLSPVSGDLEVSLAYLPRPTGIVLRLTAMGDTDAAAGMALGRATAVIRTVLGRRLYSEDGEDLHFVVGDMLIEAGRTISVAESCTGGLIGHLLTEVPGVSSRFMEGITAYSNQAKIRDLDVNREIIESFGAVSEQVARAMAVGVRRRASTDIGLSTTGIAGPTGGTADKPVGLVYTGIAHEEGVEVTRNVFAGPRGVIKVRAATHALDLVRMYLSR
ncbi:MAG: competence/damage-inducible protein A [bacterium]|jgi:nicotinamide-nucleotide amidase